MERKAKSLWRKVGLYFTWLSLIVLVFLVTGFSFIVLPHELSWVAPVWLISSIAPLVLGIIFWIFGRRYDAKLDRLKNDGVAYVAENIEILPMRFFQMQGNMCLRVRCSYKNDKGVEHMVTSGALAVPKTLEHGLFSLFSTGRKQWRNYDFSAMVYADRNYPEDYAVDLRVSVKQ
jgi:hypothetical protein